MELRKSILLVEDEVGVVDFIRRGLIEEEYEVSVALDGLSAIEMAGSSDFDLILLDIMLPDINGIEVCRTLRGKGIKSPILFLTALGTSENIALGLNEGGDDYLVKPFKFIELHARINALLRRASLQDNDTMAIYKVADVVLNDHSKMVTRGNQPVLLTATEYRLLLALMKNKGRVLSRMELLESAWDIHFNLGTNVVDVYINYLRKKLDADWDKKLIQTVVGMGYVMREG